MTNSKPLPEEAFRDWVHIYESNEMYITMVKTKIDFHQRDMHSHDGYEFLVPFTDMPFIHINGKILSAGKNTIVPINPWQKHGPADLMKNISFIDIMVDTHYMHKMSSTVFKKKLPCFKNEVFTLNPEIQYIIKAFIKEGQSRRPGNDLLMQSLCCQFVVGILRETLDETLMEEGKLCSGYQKKIKKVVEYLDTNFNDNCTLNQLAEIAGMSRYHFIRAFKGVIGKSPYDYLLDVRIQKAKDLLIPEDASITEVGIKCGFNNNSHFSTVFKKKTGLSPKKYIEKMYL